MEYGPWMQVCKETGTLYFANMLTIGVVKNTRILDIL